MTFSVDDRAQGSGDFRTESGHSARAEEGLAVGYDSGDAVSRECQLKFPFTGGRAITVLSDIDDMYVDVERQLTAMLARD
jgi:arylsulfatase